MKRRLRQEKLSGKVEGREKHLYSLYRKMRGKGLSFSEVLDVYAFRITVDTADACYRALGVVHGLYKPVPGKFKDYIALPKTQRLPVAAHGAVRTLRCTHRGADPEPGHARRG